MIGKAIKELREKQGIGLNQLAKLAGIPPSVLHYIENENRDPRFSTVCKIAKALGVSVSYFEKYMEAHANVRKDKNAGSSANR